ncbi:MAG: hypothetical protein FJ311_09095 [Rhodospirillales bacterium]|jgi:hypothetical protein|nr:hypothetical protein [Rhodospirillales bacterium]
MHPNSIFLLVLAISLFNGLASPWLGIVFLLAPVWITSLFPGIASFLNLPEFVFYFASILVSTATLLIGGVPAALYERLLGGEPGGRTAMLIWLGGAVFLSLPALGKVLPLFG